MGSWSPQTQSGDLSLENFTTESTTRSLSAAKTSQVSSQYFVDQALLYYENPTGKVSVLCWQAVGVQDDEKWIDITSQKSNSLPDEFRNAPGSATEDNSKTLDESLIPNIFTLSAPFACRPENQSTGQTGIGAVFYSPNASGFEFQSNFYSTGLSGAGNFSSRMHFVFSYAFMMFIS